MISNRNNILNNPLGWKQQQFLVRVKALHNGSGLYLLEAKTTVFL